MSVVFLDLFSVTRLDLLVCAYGKPRS
jgi:hypothetical protein